MKVLSRILYVLLGIIVLACVVILLCAKNPSMAKRFSNITHGLSKDKEAAQAGSEEEEVDIEALLREIESRNAGSNTTEPSEKRTDLGLVDPTVYEALPDYYEAVSKVIREHYEGTSVLTFKLWISEAVFPEWYDANFDSNNGNSGGSFSFSVDYEKEDTGYLIDHVVTFE